MLVVIGVNSSSDIDFEVVGGVLGLGLLLLLDDGLPHLWEPFEPLLLLFFTFTPGNGFVGVSGALWTFTAEVLMLAESLEEENSSTVLTEPSRALEEVVGANPESLFQLSSSHTSFVVRRSAG